MRGWRCVGWRGWLVLSWRWRWIWGGSGGARIALLGRRRGVGAARGHRLAIGLGRLGDRLSWLSI